MDERYDTATVGGYGGDPAGEEEGEDEEISESIHWEEWQSEKEREEWESQREDRGIAEEDCLSLDWKQRLVVRTLY